MQNKKRFFHRLFQIFVSISFTINVFLFVSVIFNKDIRRNILPINKITRKLKKFFSIEPAKYPPGFWKKIRSSPIQKVIYPGQKEKMRKLESLGYLSGYRKAPQQKNITIYKKKLTYNGLNLLCSGHGPEAILMDMEGNQLHKWSYDVYSVWSDYKPPNGSHNHEMWRRVHLMNNGDLLAIFEGVGLIKIDKNSNLIWGYQCKAHHDLFVSKEKQIFVLTRSAKIYPKYNKIEPILEDFITILDQNGQEINRISILKCIENSDYMTILNRKEIKGDFLHTNTIELIDNRLASKFKEIREGNVLLSIPRFDMVCVVDLEKEQVVWAIFNLWGAQHHPTVLKNGNILIFDNVGAKDQSRVLEFNPLTQQICWKYTGTSKKPFFSLNCGSCQRLPNGNTLISETEGGRAFEVTPDKKIVWEFFNPFRAGKKKELIAAVYEIIRIDPNFPLDWL